MAQRHRGQAVIIVNRNFPNVVNENMPRKGATKDIKKMFKLFTLLDFRVKSYWNLKGKDMIEKINKACEDKTNEDCECFVLVISSHGEEQVNLESSPGNVVHEQVVHGTDWGSVFVEDILKKMENLTLKGKPKLCFIQACRHSLHHLKTEEDAIDTGVKMEVSGTGEGASGDGDGGKDAEDIVDSLFQGAMKEDMTGEMTGDMIDPLSLSDSDDESIEGDDEMDVGGGGRGTNRPPLQDVVPSFCPRDFLVMYPVQPHKYAVRSNTYGSWMLHYMYQRKEMLLTKGCNIFHYLTKVTADVATRNYKGKAQLQMAPTIVHRLTADVCFHALDNSMMSRWIQERQTKV